MMQSRFDEQPADLLEEITLLLRAGCSVEFVPLPNPYGVMVAQIKIAPPADARAGSAIGLPLAPYVHQFNLLTDTAKVAAALRNARRLFVALSAD